MARAWHAIRRRLRAAVRELESPGERTWDLRYQRLSRRRRYRRAVLATEVCTGAALANVVLLAVGHPGTMSLAVLQLVAMLSLLRVAAPRLEGAPSVLAQLDVLTTTGFTMGLVLVNPGLFPLAAIYLSIIPMAMALLLSWTPRAHTAAVVGYLAAAVCFFSLAPVSIEVRSRAEALAGCGAACLLSVFANFEETFWLQEIVRRMQQLREKQTRLRAFANEREREARLDPLTDLASRRALDEDLEALELGDRRDVVTSIAIVDLDHFKGYNDRYGHPAGDGLLTQLGACFRTGLRAGDRGYRYGGDEFVFLMPGTRAAEAGLVISRVAEAFEMQAIDHASNEPWGRATFSAGVADTSEAQIFGDVLRLADERLYRAKDLGGNRTTGPEASERVAVR